MAYYIDSSAAVKLIVREKGSAALRRWIAGQDPDLASAVLLKTEVLRAVRRGAPSSLQAAHGVLAAVTLIAMPHSTYDLAATLEPLSLRSLDALHLAVALGIADGLEAILTYDERLQGAAGKHGLRVMSPS